MTTNDTNRFQPVGDVYGIDGLSINLDCADRRTLTFNISYPTDYRYSDLRFWRQIEYARIWAFRLQTRSHGRLDIELPDFATLAEADMELHGSASNDF
jgi:hypothetical protein